jgi:hypothetical protein
MSTKKTGDDAAPRAAANAAVGAPMLISLDFSALIRTIEEQNNRIEMLEMQLRKKDEEVTALAASVTVREQGGGGGQMPSCLGGGSGSNTRVGAGQHC